MKNRFSNQESMKICDKSANILARKLNDIVYESEFNSYKELMKKRREHISQGGGQYSYQFAIKEVVEDLEELLEEGFNLVDRETRSTQK